MVLSFMAKLYNLNDRKYREGTLYRKGPTTGYFMVKSFSDILFDSFSLFPRTKV